MATKKTKTATKKTATKKPAAKKTKSKPKSKAKGKSSKSDSCSFMSDSCGESPTLHGGISRLKSALGKMLCCSKKKY
jgi:hypothetical protein